MKTKLILLFAFFICLDAVANVYPISPRPLRKLIKESQFIAYAHVIDTNETSGEYETSKAVLVIYEVLQGNIQKDTILVNFFPHFICPAPAHYAKGMDVLVFLDRDKEIGYRTHALSYGAKELNKEGFEVYKSRIQEMQSILKIKDHLNQNIKIMDWLVECAANTYTRWEGTYELSPQSDFMSLYDQSQGVLAMKELLDPNHRKKLKDALFTIETLTYEDLALADLLVKDYKEEVSSFLIQKLRNTKIDQCWFVHHLMMRAAYYSNRKDLIKIIDDITKLDYLNPEHAEPIKKLNQEFMSTL